jgi:glycosyltransferase involved in cell wall biosynthesis
VKIAYFSPLAPLASGVASYSAALLPFLARRARIVVFVDDPGAVDGALREQFEVRAVDSFGGPLQERFDVCVYQMGSHVGFHESIYHTLLRFPGVTTLHDLNYHSFYGDLYLMRDRRAAYTREMAYAYGVDGSWHARKAQMGLEAYDVQRYPLYDRIGDISAGVIVHSEYARRLVVGRCGRTPVVHINQPVPIAPFTLTQAEAKIRLGYDPDDILMASFGYVAPNKRVDVALEAFVEVSRSWPNAHYAIVGKVVEGYDLASVLDRLDLGDGVRVVGYADVDTFRTYLRACDIGINLRYPTNGETSATLLALMGEGKTTVVSRVDAFVELPDAACVKVDVGLGELAQVETLLAGLIEDPDLRRRIGENASAYVRRECDPEAVAGAYVGFIQRVIGAG